MSCVGILFITTTFEKIVFEAGHTGARDSVMVSVTYFIAHCEGMWD